MWIWCFNIFPAPSEKNVPLSRKWWKVISYILHVRWYGVYHSRSKQRTDQRVFVLTLKFLALKKLFSANPTILKKQKKSKLIFCPFKHKKTSLKSCSYLALTCFFTAQPNPRPQPRIDFSYYRYVPRPICLLICDVYQY